MSKSQVGIFHAPAGHWVGDGFPVRTLFSYDRLGRLLSPFLLLDYAGPHEFTPADAPRGVGEHPHRGFETVTMVYSGEFAHRDTAGNSGTIGAGDVQWMTAGSGVLHEESHSAAFTASGGLLKAAQLWVNLPARDKMTAPRYQAITAQMIPSVQLAGGAGRLRVIAGHAFGVEGPAKTFSELNVWDATIEPGEVSLPLPAGHNAVLAVLGGQIRVQDGHLAGDGDIVVLDAEGEGVTFQVLAPTLLLVLSGQPLNEPIAGYGPFVMNTREEIITAFDDLNAGRFGKLD